MGPEPNGGGCFKHREEMFSVLPGCAAGFRVSCPRIVAGILPLSCKGCGEAKCGDWVLGGWVSREHGQPSELSLLVPLRVPAALWLHHNWAVAQELTFFS